MTAQKERLVAEVMRRFKFARVAELMRKHNHRWGRVKRGGVPVIELYQPTASDLREKALELLEMAVAGEKWVSGGGLLAMADGTHVRLAYVIEEQFVERPEDDRDGAAELVAG